MTLPRYFLENQALREGDIFSLDKEDCQHARKVLRLREGDQVEVSDGQGRHFSAFLREAEGNSLAVELGQEIWEDPESPLETTLVQGLLKGDKMDQVIRQATELGVDRIVPLFSYRSVARFGQEKAEKKVQRWQRIARGAASQSRRSLIPRVEAPIAWEELPEKLVLVEGALNLLFWEGEDQRPYPREAGMKWPRVNLLVGPEGGFHQEEVVPLQEEFLTVSIGPRILRAETAAVAALCMVQLLYGDMGGLCLK